ncbi:MAG TPA: RNA polymerase sporulation sigma factor SigH [Clostridiaceae bacterium]|nr:RNA polymerase sporulation sigma factor SigH [Clostridiaceae bacterium]
MYVVGGASLNSNVQLGLNSAHNTVDDEKIVLSAKAGNEKALNYIINKYKSYVRAKTKTYFLIGADKEDIFQEGMIGLYKAIRDYKEDKLTSFKAFADVCITRQIITAVKTATRQKHIPLNSYISLNKPLYEDDAERTLIDIIGSSDKISDPEEMMITREEIAAMEDKLNKVLSKLELNVLTLYLEGKSYQEVAEEMNRHVKSIDNALQRVKRKLEKYFYEEKMINKK